MNIKETIIILVLALATTKGIEYLFFNKKVATNAAVSGQRFVAPENQQDLKPLNTEIDFLDTQKPESAVKTEVETPLARYVFSTHGATLERFDVKRMIGGKLELLTGIEPVATTDREKRCLLVALDDKTPFYYNFQGRVDHADRTELTYQVTTRDAKVEKVFTVYKDTYKLDMKLVVTPRKETVQARIFYPAPLRLTKERADIVSAVVSNEGGSLKKTARKSINVREGWFAPAVFGSENRYLLNVLFADPEQFAQRAYFVLNGQHGLTSIVEGPAVTETTTWNTSFYVGPKETSTLAAVDPRLEQTLDYSGWLGPIAKLMIKLLVFFYGFLGNYGLAIIALTILLRLLMLPLTLKGSEKMKEQQEMSKKMAYLKKRYKDDPERLKLEQAELIKKHGLPMAGCLPVLIQIPLFISLSRALSSSMELYHAKFLWINDLSAYDPYYILPVMVSGAMLLQATTVDSKQRVQFLVFALFIGALAVNFSAGLCLYFFMSTVLGVGQTILQKRLKSSHPSKRWI